MKEDTPPKINLFQPGSWRTDDCVLTDHESFDVRLNPNAREQSQLMDLIGRINYRILSGDRVYVEVGGVVYKTLYGGYWRSVFTGIEHYLLRCQEIRGALWADKPENPSVVDLPIAYSREGWLASGQSLSFLLSRDQ